MLFSDCICVFTLNVCLYTFIFLFGFLRNDCHVRVARSRKECTGFCLYRFICVCFCVYAYLRLEFIHTLIYSIWLPSSVSRSLAFKLTHTFSFFITYWFISFPNHVKIYFAVDDFNIVDDDDDGNNISIFVCVNACLRLNTIAIPLLHITFIVVCSEFTILFSVLFFFFLDCSVSTIEIMLL